MLEQLIDYLHSDLDISLDAISIAKRTKIVEVNTLPMVLWQYGFLDLGQLEQVFNWLEISY